MKILQNYFQMFLRDERGVVIVDWVVLLAAVLIGTVVFTQNLGPGMSNLSTAHQSPLAPIEFPATSP